MRFNTNRCRVTVSGHKHEQVWSNIGKDLMWESNDVKLHGMSTNKDFKV